MKGCLAVLGRWSWSELISDRPETVKAKSPRLKSLLSMMHNLLLLEEISRLSGAVCVAWEFCLRADLARKTKHALSQVSGQGQCG